MNHSTTAAPDGVSPGGDGEYGEFASRRRVPAWLMSAGIHGVLLLVLAWSVRLAPRGLPVEPGRTAGIVLVRPSQGRTEYFSEQEVSESATDRGATSTSSALPATASALPTAAEIPIDLAGALPSDDALTSGMGSDLADALPGAGELTAGDGPGKKLGGEAKTYLFGIEGEGRDFVYVFDRSSSMEGFGGRPLAASKRELISSLQALQQTHQFQIIFYNNEVSAFNPNAPQPARMMFADETNKQLAERYVEAIHGTGGTEHMKPLSLALRMAPDVIFFLTDAAEPQLSTRQLDQLRRMNSGSVVHTIEFGSGPSPGGDNFLKKLARQNGGKHVYVDISQLSGR